MIDDEKIGHSFPWLNAKAKECNEIKWQKIQNYNQGCGDHVLLVCQVLDVVYLDIYMVESIWIFT